MLRSLFGSGLGDLLGMGGSRRQNPLGGSGSPFGNLSDGVEVNLSDLLGGLSGILSGVLGGRGGITINLPGANEEKKDTSALQMLANLGDFAVELEKGHSGLFKDLGEEIDGVMTRAIKGFSQNFAALKSNVDVSALLEVLDKVRLRAISLRETHPSAADEMTKVEVRASQEYVDWDSLVAYDATREPISETISVTLNGPATAVAEAKAKITQIIDDLQIAALVDAWKTGGLKYAIAPCGHLLSASKNGNPDHIESNVTGDALRTRLEAGGVTLVTLEDVMGDLFGDLFGFSFGDSPDVTDRATAVGSDGDGNDESRSKVHA